MGTRSARAATVHHPPDTLPRSIRRRDRFRRSDVVTEDHADRFAPTVGWYVRRLHRLLVGFDGRTLPGFLGLNPELALVGVAHRPVCSRFEPSATSLLDGPAGSLRQAAPRAQRTSGRHRAVIARSTDNVADAPAPDGHGGCRHGVGLKITTMSRLWTWVRCGCGNNDGPSPGAGHSRHPPGSPWSPESTEIVEAHSRRGEAGAPATRSGWRPIDERMHRAIDGQASVRRRTSSGSDWPDLAAPDGAIRRE